MHDMVEYIESEIMDSEQYDLTQIMEQTERYLPKAKALVPARPLNLDDGQSYFGQWPMTNLRAKEAEKAAQMFERKKQMLDEQGANDAFFGNNEFGSTSNKQVANILESSERTKSAAEQTKQEQPKVNLDDAAWGDDDDDDDLGFGDDEAKSGEEETKGDQAADEEESEIFIPPTPGSDPILEIQKQNPTNAAINAVAGDFLRALECL